MSMHRNLSTTLTGEDAINFEVVFNYYYDRSEIPPTVSQIIRRLIKKEYQRISELDPSGLNETQ